ncbi:MAG TPA: hypothetical protein VK162_06575 [Streptosporangiaceae bacterium]|nr:hypothetical protein [Streptosporangiaceae bacterium]
MTNDDLLREAARELYSADPDEFIERRGVLVARARAAGEAPAAKSIAALRKPTRSAWVLNQLVRAAPDVASQLAELGQEFRAAQRSLDGQAIRELSVRRRQLIDALARQAFTVSGLHSPPAAIRDEVTATLGAALADPEVAELLAAGALERAARRDGFGIAGRPILTVVPPAGRRASPAGQAPASQPPAAPAPARSPVDGSAAARPPAARPAAEVTALAAVRAKAERERRRQAADDAQRALAEAERERRRQAADDAQRALAEADRAAAAAARAEREQESAVRLIEEQLADARHRLGEARQRLDDARLEARRARAGQRQARQALDRLQREPSSAPSSPGPR